MQLLELIGQNLFEELANDYRPIFDAILLLEKEFPVVAANQLKFKDDENTALSNTQAHLLYTMQGSVPKASRRTRRELRDALHVMQFIPGVRTVLVTLLVESFSATIYMIEHLFFLNREIERRIEAGLLPEYTAAQIVYPKERVDGLIALSYTAWKADNVLQNAGQK